MSDALSAITGWMCLMVGIVGLLRGTTLMLPRGHARDSTGVPGRLVLVESAGLTLGGAALLSDGWVYLIWPALVLGSIGVFAHVRIWLRRRLDHPSVDDLQ